MEAVGHKLTKMLKSCEWQNEPCSEKNFTMVPYGHSLTQCYAFNADQSKPLYTKLPGFYGGLKMTLDIQQYQYLSSEIKGAGLFIAVLDDIQQSEAISDIASQVRMKQNAHYIVTYQQICKNFNIHIGKPLPLTKCSGECLSGKWQSVRHFALKVLGR